MLGVALESSRYSDHLWPPHFTNMTALHRHCREHIDVYTTPPSTPQSQHTVHAYSMIHTWKTVLTHIWTRHGRLGQQLLGEGAQRWDWQLADYTNQTPYYKELYLSLKWSRLVRGAHSKLHRVNCTELKRLVHPVWLQFYPFKNESWAYCLDLLRIMLGVFVLTHRCRRRSKHVLMQTLVY